MFNPRYHALRALLKIPALGTFLVVQWRRLCTPNAGVPGSIPGQGTRSHLLQLRVCMSQLRPDLANKSKFFFLIPAFSSVQFSSVAQSCLTLCDPMNCSTPGLPVHRQLLEFTQTHVHWFGDAIQPSHPLSSPSPPAPSPSQHQSLFQWVNSSHEVAKVLEFQL